MNQTRISTILIALLSAMVLNGQVLYRISGNGVKAPSYVFATNRIVGLEFLDSVPNLLPTFAKCKTVIAEFAMQDYEAIATLRTAALLPDSVLLDRYFTTEEYQSIDEAFRLAFEMGMDKLCRMKPSYLTALYRDDLLHKWLDYDSQRSMEAFFEALAAERNIPVRGLDEVGETMYILFDREPFHHQCKELVQIIEYPERETRIERNIADMYRYGRLTDISYALTSPDNNSTLSYSDYQVFAARNKEWVKRLRSYLVEGLCFITLDANYLGGEKGLLEQLRAAGYKVKAVNR